MIKYILLSAAILSNVAIAEHQGHPTKEEMLVAFDVWALKEKNSFADRLIILCTDPQYTIKQIFKEDIGTDEEKIKAAMKVNFLCSDPSATIDRFEQKLAAKRWEIEIMVTFDDPRGDVHVR